MKLHRLLYGYSEFRDKAEICGSVRKSSYGIAVDDDHLAQMFQRYSRYANRCFSILMSELLKHKGKKTISAAKTVTITEEEYKSLLQSARELQALESGGVDNWEWYGEAMENVWKNEEEEE